jgi:plasmid stability protein
VATLYVRNVPAELYAELQRWASESGRSVNAEVLALLEREAATRRRDEDWLGRIVALREELKLTSDDADFMIRAIREDRDRGHKPELGY